MRSPNVLILIIVDHFLDRLYHVILNATSEMTTNANDSISLNSFMVMVIFFKNIGVYNKTDVDIMNNYK